MTVITDEFMRKMLSLSKTYCIVILRVGAKKNEPGVEKILWEHGRRNFALRADGLLPIVCRVVDGSDVKGVGIFNASVEETEKMMNEDHGVKAGVFVYEITPAQAFPGTPCQSERAFFCLSLRLVFHSRRGWDPQQARTLTHSPFLNILRSFASVMFKQLWDNGNMNSSARMS